MLTRKAALISAATLLLGTGLFGVSALPASGDPTASTDRSLATGWDGIRVASLAAAEQRLDAEAGEDGETLVFFSIETGFAEVDLPPAGFSPGDFVLFEEQLYTDRARTQPAGRDSVRQELSLTTAHAEATFKIPGGKITVAGTQFSNLDPTYSITGGTGQYLAVGGLFIPFFLPEGDVALFFRVIR